LNWPIREEGRGGEGGAVQGLGGGEGRKRGGGGGGGGGEKERGKLSY